MKIRFVLPIILITIIYLPFVVVKSVWESSLPKNMTGTDLPLVTSETTVIKDSFGVPHIKANSKEEMYHTLGFVMASDRLFQMDIHRRVASGRLSEIFGARALEADKLFRTFRFKAAMKKLLGKSRDRLNKDMLRYLDAFYKGVNHYIDTRPLPIEFKLLGYRPDHFDMLDGISFIGYMGYSFATSFRNDLLFQELQDKLSEKMLDDLKIFPEKVSRAGVPVVLNKKEIEIWNNIIKTTESTLSRFGGNLHGSNSWVVSGKRTKSGYPILANDPHIATSHPGTWYEAHIESGSYKMYGHFLPILPFPVLGHNEHYGWAMTMSKIDEINLYNEQVDREKGLVKFKGEWVALEKESEVIKVKGGPDYNLEILITPHGPLINSIMDAGKIKNDLSLRWVYFDDDNYSIEALYKLGTASSMDEFKSAIALGSAPGLNISYADAKGNIGWWVYGKIPLMPKGVMSDRFLDGSSGKEEYLGYLPFEKNPHSVNPDIGYIVSANYIPAGFDNKWQGLWEPSDRFDTITQMLNVKEKWDLSDFQIMQTRAVDATFMDIMSVLTKEMDERAGELTGIYLEAYNRLKRWNYQSDMSSTEATMFHLWNRTNVRLIVDELSSDSLEKYCDLTTYWFFYKRVLNDMGDVWWDQVNTSVVEHGGDIIIAGWKETIDTLKSKFGGDINTWYWGRLHTLEYEHPLGSVSPLNKIFNIGPLPASGGFNQINNMRASGCGNELKITSLPSTRRLIDFAYPELSMGILPAGQSGHVLSPNYQDQVRMYLDGEYRYQLLDWDLILSEATDKILFY